MEDDLPVGAEAARLLATLSEGRLERVIHLTSGEARAEALARVLADVAPNLDVVAFPPWDCLPYDWASPSPVAMGRRMAALRRVEGAGSWLVLTSPAALLQRVVPPGALPARALRVGEAFNPQAFAAWAEGVGYRLDERVDEAGEVAVRGEVVDVFPAAAPGPFRVQLGEGDRIKAIRPYDPATQISTGEVEELWVDAATELPPGEPATEEVPSEPEPGAERGLEHWLPDRLPVTAMLVDHLPGARLLATEAALAGARAFLRGLPAAQVDRLRAQVEAGEPRRALPPERLYLAPGEWDALRGEVTVLPGGAASEPPAIAGDPRPRAALARAVREAGRTILLAATPRDRDRMARMARSATEVTAAGSWKEAMAVPPGSVATLLARLDRGFHDGDLLVLTARDVLGSRAEDAGGATVLPPWLAEVQELALGDLVVHEEEGLGRLEGLEPVEGGEAIRLAYAEGQALLVPVADAGKLWRYGADEGEVSLDKLGGTGWAKRREKLAEALATTAKALVRAAHERATRTAPKLVPDAAPFETVAGRFGWEETPDQRAAIRAVLHDLASGRPMNRLLVGDVGFGKTEVAIRAVAAAAFAGTQVVLVAPTTVLARQHFLTLSRRFEGTGVGVAQLSRLLSPAEARRVREGLAEGRVRIVVGTHAVLGKGTAFAKLGLVVIDEEQRFGAGHKRALRDLAAEAHVLSMTATPIPRTLQGALVGLQDLSLLTTAPARRRPVRTVVAEHEAGLLRDALGRERRRGGQSFVVVPRVEDMEATSAEIQRLAPRLKLRLAHGKLPAHEIDQAMTSFADGDGDVLLATAIVESGLDVPRANTMLVLRPDLFGLAQLHQLRGRVGRGGSQAYCWLLTEPGAELPEPTLRRLGTLEAMDALGTGFALAASDLDRRGAGELFGEEQSGHLALVGPALHAEMLAAALRAERGEPDATAPEIRIEAAVALPESYIAEPDLRVTLYNRLARARAPDEAERLADEVEDRFGPPPPEARALLRLAAIRARAAALGVTRVSAGPEAVALDFAPEARPEEAPQGLDWAGDRLVWRQPLAGAAERLDAALEVLARLA